MKSTKRNKDLYYTEVWGDTVVLKELLYACLIGVVLTMGMFLIGREFFSVWKTWIRAWLMAMPSW